MEWNQRRTIEAIIIGIIVGIYILLEQHYTLNRFVFVCNDTQCQITHYNQKDNEIKKKSLDINNMKEFEYRLEKRKHNFFESRRQKRRNREVYYIYVNCNDGGSYKLSPLFIRKENMYYAQKVVDELNNELKIKNINYTFR